MRSFWTYIQNDQFAVGTTGQTVYVYDRAGNELAKFKDMKYAYDAMFCPTKPLLMVKSTDVWFGFYSLETMTLLKRLRVRKPNNQPQDHGFCFSLDGERFYNSEYQEDQTSQLVVYETETFTEVARYFEKDRYVIDHIEYDLASEAYYILGFDRARKGDCCFVMKFTDDGKVDDRSISHKLYDHLQTQKSWERSGFVTRSFTPGFAHDAPDQPIPLEGIYANDDVIMLRCLGTIM